MLIEFHPQFNNYIFQQFVSLATDTVPNPFTSTFKTSDAYSLKPFEAMIADTCSLLFKH